MICRDVIDGGGSSEGSSNAPSILLSGRGGSILKEITNGVRSGGERGVWLRRDEGGETEDS